MKAAFPRLIACWLLPAAVLTGDPKPPEPVLPVPAPAAAPRADEPWIGLEVSKLNEAMRTHLADVPEGVGFVVTAIEESGPSAKAGLRRFDILSRFEDQWLINEAQFGTLIRMKKPGERVAMSIVRAGEPKVIEVEIGVMPEHERTAALDPAEIPIFPSGVPGMPRQVVYPRDRTAEVTRHDGSIARLRYEGEEALVRIEDADGGEVYDGPLRKDGKFAVPEEWRCTVGALLRSMHRSTDKEWQPRQPWPRVVMPAPAPATGG